MPNSRGGVEMKAKPIIILFGIIVLIILSFNFWFPLIRQSINQSLNKEFIVKVNQDALSAKEAPSKALDCGRRFT